eukprot:4354083-Karenia_brevis.AAC.1
MGILLGGRNGYNVLASYVNPASSSTGFAITAIEAQGAISDNQSNKCSVDQPLGSTQTVRRRFAPPVRLRRSEQENV